MINISLDFIEGGVYRVDLGSHKKNGYLTSGYRYCLLFRRIDKYKAIMIPFTSQKTDYVKQTELLFEKGTGGLVRDSKLLVDHFRNLSIDKINWSKCTGRLSHIEMIRIKVILDNILK